MNHQTQIQLADSSLFDQLRTLGTQVGNTPLYPLDRFFQKSGVRILAKLEWRQLGGSVKARPAYNIIAEAILSGRLHRDNRLLDASSGNTAIAYATVATALGIPITLVIPDNASESRKLLLQALGAELIYTSKFGGTDEAQEKAAAIAAADPDLYFYADQYNNEHNWRAHYKHTALEINAQTRGKLTHFVAGLGTTGTFTGTGRRLKELDPDIMLVALQPDTAMHGLEGWKHLQTAKIPGIYDPGLADLHMEVSSEEAFVLIKEVAETEGLLLSPSAAANLLGAKKVAEHLDEGVVVTVFPDNADKYPEVLRQIFA